MTPFAQAVMVLRWYRDTGVRVAALACDAAIASTTTYRYLHEGIDVLAAQAPDLHTELVAAKAAGAEVVLLDGTLIDTDRVTDGPDQDGHRVEDRWYSGKHKRHGGNVQIIADQAGRPLGAPPACGGGTSPVEPGSTHDLAAARAHVLPNLYWAASYSGLGLPTLADKGYTWTGSGIRIPYPRPRASVALHPATAGWNSYINTTRAAVERSIATLKTSWRTLKHITLDRNRIGDITASALVLHRHQHTY